MSRLSDSQALELFEHASLEELKQMASAVRAKILPLHQATYIIMRIVSYTNICVADCAYCAFYRRPGEAGGYVLTPEEIFRKVDALVEKGGSLVAMEGGFNPELKIQHYENLLRLLRRRYGNRIEIYGPTSVEVLFIARNSKVPLNETLVRLREAGLRWIPGGGAEILTPEWRRKLSPKKYSIDQYFEVMDAAYRAGYGITATMVIGFGEPYAARVAHLRRLRDFQDRTGAFASFLCWTYQAQNTRLGGEVTSNEDYLRSLAVSRLYLDNIRHVRASILTQNEGGADALLYGADDCDVPLEDQVTELAGARVEGNVEKVLEWVNGRGVEPVRREPWSIDEGRKDDRFARTSASLGRVKVFLASERTQ